MRTNAPDPVKIFAQAPRPALRPFIRRFLVVEFPTFHRDAHLPDTGPVAAFSLRGRCRLDGARWAPPAAFTGLRGTLRAHEHCEGHAVLLASFTPAGAGAFLRPPMEAFAGTTADLAGVLAPATELEYLLEQLGGAPNHARRAALLEDFLLARRRLAAPDPLVTAAVAWLQQGGARITGLARHIGLSQSALERRFRRSVGLPPKQFASLVRLRRAVRLRGGSPNLAALAQAAGYFDQAHFIHDFRRATGCAPAEFFRQARAV